MRILFTNEIEGSSVSAVNGSTNYPADSIYHVFLRKKFKSDIDNDTLTIDLSEAVAMNCFFMGYHNVVDGTVSFFDDALAPIGTPISLASAGDIFVNYFDSISVKRITVEIESSGAQVYVGGIGAGSYHQMPTDVTAGSPFAIEDATTGQKSAGGQVSRNQAPSLRSRQYTWPDMGLSDAMALDAVVRGVGIMKPIWIDLFEGAPALDAPMYGVITEPRQLTNPAAGRFDMSIRFLEAR